MTKLVVTFALFLMLDTLQGFAKAFYVAQINPSVYVYVFSLAYMATGALFWKAIEVFYCGQNK